MRFPARISQRAARSGLTTLGSAISTVGSHLDELQQKRQTAEDTLAIAERRNQVATEVNDLNKTLETRSGEQGFDPNNFTRSQLDTIQQRALDGLSPSARRRYEPELIQSITRQGISLGNAEHRRAVQRGLVRMQDVVSQRVNEISENPDLYPERLAATNQELDELHASGLLTADQLKAKKKEAKTLFVQIAAGKIAQEDASEAVRSFLFGFTPAPGRVGEIQSAIANEFHKAGLSSLIGLVLADIETGGKFDPAIRPIDPETGERLSSARGLFQFIKSTAEAYGIDPNNATAAEQIRAAVKYTQDSVNHLKSVLGRDPEIGEVYLAHLLGRGGATSVLKANTTDLMRNVLPNWLDRRRPDGSIRPGVATSNRLNKNMTVSQFVAKFEGRVERSAKKFDASFEGDSLAISRLGRIGITKQDILRLPPSAFGSLVKDANANLKIELQDKIADATAMIAVTGSQDILNDRDLGDLTRVLGERKARDVVRGFELAQQRFSDKQQLTQMSPAERAKFVNDLKPKVEDGSEGFAARTERFENAKKALKEVEDALERDAFAFVSANTEEGRQALSQFNAAPNGPEGLTRREAAVDALLNAQSERGVPANNAKILSGALAERFTAQMNALTTRQEAQAFLAGLQQTYGRHFPRIFRELVAKGADPRIVTLQTVSNGQVAIELLEAMSVERSSKEGKKFYKDRAGDAGDDVDAEVTKQLSPFLRVLPGRDVMVAQAYQNAVKLLAFKRLAEQGGEATTAVEFAVNALVGERIEVVGRVAIPKGDSDKVEKVTRVLDNQSVVIRSLEDRIDSSRVDSVFGTTEAARREDYIRSIRSQGEFVLSSDGQGVNLLDPRGSLVLDRETGERLFISFDELEKLGERIQPSRGRRPAVLIRPDVEADPNQIEPEPPRFQTRGPRRRQRQEGDPAEAGIPETAPSPEQRARGNPRARRVGQ